MNRHRRVALVVAAVLTAVLGVLPGGAATAGAEADPPPSGTESPVPIIFVHGFFGSGQQFESQAMRFVSNGFPADHIDVMEYNSLAYSLVPATRPGVVDALDARIDALRAATGAEQVHLLGHSQGTGVARTYLADESRADKVASYVNLDGSSGQPAPAGVDSLAIWGEWNPAGDLVGATNVHFPDKGHTEVVTSADTFGVIYEYFTGTEPETIHVRAQPTDQITVEGRAVLFPENLGAAGTTLNVWEVDPATGTRTDQAPVHTAAIDATGDYGPFDVRGGVPHEFEIVRPGEATHHHYVQPFTRSTQWMRLLTSEPDGLVVGLIERSEASTNLTIFRNKEWWGDQGEAGDLLTVDGVNILNGATAPRSGSTIAMFALDEGSDGETDLSAPVASLAALPFLSGANIFIPAADPPDATVTVAATPRGGEGPEVVNLPNWRSSDRLVSVPFRDFHQTVLTPAAPTGVAAEGGAELARVSWDAPQEVGSSALVGFEVLDVDDVVVARTGPATTEVDVIGLDPGDGQRFRVVARNATGASPPSLPSNAVDVELLTPGFTDVPDGHPFAAVVRWAAARGVTTGYDDGSFQPTVAVSRQAAAAFLYRTAGLPDGTPDGAPMSVNVDDLFSDVDENHPFVAEIMWLATEGIAEGYDDGTFRPTEPVSRQAMAAMLHRLAGAPEVTLPAAPTFSDVDESHPFAFEIEWMAGQGLAAGFSDGTFQPAIAVSRQAAVAFLYRWTTIQPSDPPDAGEV
ncbi:MAG: alpha/beta fold hydrolase [Acidimicrobiia bacterium]|nr:alpha/beta fold hydrolase [Acidimicrobiia bacterium]